MGSKADMDIYEALDALQHKAKNDHKMWSKSPCEDDFYELFFAALK